MAKNTVNLDKVKIEFEKTIIQKQIEAYYELGVWLHQKKSEEQQKMNEKLEALRNIWTND